MKKSKPTKRALNKSDSRIDKYLRSPNNPPESFVFGFDKNETQETSKSSAMSRTQRDQEMRAAKKELVAVEYLEHLANTNRALFKQLVDRKMYVKDFNQHYEAMKDREKISKQRIEALRQIYNYQDECKFEPYINPNSRRIMSKSPSKARSVNMYNETPMSKKDFKDLSFAKPKFLQVNAKVAESNRSVPFRNKKPVQSENNVFLRSSKSANKFDESRFNAHMKRMEEWNAKSKSRKAKKLLQGFVEPHIEKQPLAVKFKGFGKTQYNDSPSFLSFRTMAKLGPKKIPTNYFEEDRSNKELTQT